MNGKLFNNFQLSEELCKLCWRSPISISVEIVSIISGNYWIHFTGKSMEYIFKSLPMIMLEMFSVECLLWCEFCFDSRKKKEFSGGFQKEFFKWCKLLNSRSVYFIKTFQSKWNFEGLIKSRGIIRISFWRKTNKRIDKKNITYLNVKTLYLKLNYGSGYR